MQPYLFPYVGYFQLIKAVDHFIVYDDVQWRKGGWINRNLILVNERAEYITLPVKKDSFTKNINQREFAASFDHDKTVFLRKITQAYELAPYFSQALHVVTECFASSDRNVATFLEHCLKVCCEYLHIDTRISRSSQITGKSEGLRSQDRVLDTLARVGADQYVNASGGRELYGTNDFSEQKIDLLFLEPQLREYSQRIPRFVPSLSIIDAMMFNSVEEMASQLSNYRLVR